MIFSPKLVRRYRELKAEASDCLLLMQVGAFMDVMDKDARVVAEVTGLKLQMAGEVGDPVVLGGFPKSGLDAYGLRMLGGNEDDKKDRRLSSVSPMGCRDRAGSARSGPWTWLTPAGRTGPGGHGQQH